MPTLIQSIQRCMSILQSLNLHNGATVLDLCKETGLTGGTVYRILETLRRDGFVRKDQGSTHYWLASQLRSLSDGYQDEWWIDAFARDIVDTLGRTVRWPVKLLTRSGREMLVRVTTDFESPYTDGKYPTGLRLGMLWSAAGRAYLAFCEKQERDILLKMILADAKKPNGSQRPTRRARIRSATHQDGYPVVDTSREGGNVGLPEGIDRELKRIRKAGYAVLYTSGTVFYTLSVPIVSGNVAIGAISTHIFRSVLHPTVAVTKHLATMQAAASEIGRRFPVG